MLSTATTFHVNVVYTDNISGSVKEMAEKFLNDRAESANLPPNEFQLSRGNRESVRLIVVGSRAGVIAMIHGLHLKAIANADDWSDLQPEPATGKWMSVVTKYIWLE